MAYDDEDITNTLNNFQIKASALIAAQDRQAARTEALIKALAVSTTEFKKAQIALQTMTKSGVQTQAAHQLATACEPIAKSIIVAASRAEAALSRTLGDVEAAKSQGLIVNIAIAIAAGATAAAVVVVTLPFISHLF